MLIKKVSRRFIFITLALIAAASASHARGEGAKIVVGESQLQIEDGSRAYWLNDKTLVFVGADNGTLDPEFVSRLSPNLGNFPEDKAHIYIWVMGEEARPYKSDAWPPPHSFIFQNYLCAQDGQIFYSMAPSKERNFWLILSGPLGEEKPSTFERHREREWSQSSVDDSLGYRCDQYHAPWLADHIWSVSYDQRLILDRGSFQPYSEWAYRPINPHPDHPMNLILVPDRNATPVKDVDPYWVGCVQSPPWEESFVAWACPIARFDGVKRFPIWKIHADGYAERTDFEPGDLMRPRLIPFKKGYAFTTWGANSEDGSGYDKRGLYVIDRGRPRRVLRGYVQSLALSPDGCRDALTDNPYDIVAAPKHLVVIDLCAATDPKAVPVSLAIDKPKPVDPDLPEKTALTLRYLIASGRSLSSAYEMGDPLLAAQARDAQEIIHESDEKMATVLAKLLTMEDLNYLVSFYESSAYRSVQAWQRAQAHNIMIPILEKLQGNKIPPLMAAEPDPVDKQVVETFQRAPRTVAINVKMATAQGKMAEIELDGQSAVENKYFQMLCSRPNAGCNARPRAPH